MFHLESAWLARVYDGLVLWTGTCRRDRGADREDRQNERILLCLPCGAVLVVCFAQGTGLDGIAAELGLTMSLEVQVLMAVLGPMGAHRVSQCRDGSMLKALKM